MSFVPRALVATLLATVACASFAGTPHHHHRHHHAHHGKTHHAHHAHRKLPAPNARSR